MIAFHIILAFGVHFKELDLLLLAGEEFTKVLLDDGVLVELSLIPILEEGLDLALREGNGFLMWLLPGKL